MDNSTLNATITCVVMELVIDQSVIATNGIILVTSYLFILCDWLREVANILYFVEFATNIHMI